MIDIPVVLTDVNIICTVVSRTKAPTYLAVLESVVETATGELTHVTRSVPDIDEERMPGRSVCVMEKRSTVGATIVELLEVGAVPRRVERVFCWEQIVRRSLKGKTSLGNATSDSVQGHAL